MKLITEELKQRFAEVGDQSEDENPLVIAKFFDPMGSATWYATEYYPETNICFGYVSGLVPENPLCDEWGTFSIDELESVRIRFPKIIWRNEEFIPKATLAIERDLHFKETRFDQILEIRRRLESGKDVPDTIIKERIDALEKDSQDMSKDNAPEIEM
ncbi:DUF2958 domain-containing protein [Muricauda sp. SCSIO 64092]|uniref:DUF2958 domain-containing protein n=1 Tax=Allomuricauda sp. SCSIO 64092 TaxID=2908842 RepID=UPI001FF0EE64|nr:DUF2958 domain-containing protein [Muricauda sp. SCSIO 64092]UOY05020.1 DUF2958 domain-containing protein [Muricauda sp. SCSIO 64092]